MYTSTPIIYNGKKSNRLNDVPNINEVILSLINQDVFDLVNISHRHNFWFRNMQSISNNRKLKYSYAELVKEFSIKLMNMTRLYIATRNYKYLMIMLVIYHLFFKKYLMNFNM